MAKRTGTINKALELLIRELKKLSTKEKVNIWKRVAKDLEKPSRQRRSANIYKIDKYTRKDEVAVVPGKVLSEGELTKKITVAGWQFSEKAKEKINKIGKAVSIKEIMKENPKGKKIRIMG